VAILDDKNIGRRSKKSNKKEKEKNTEAKLKGTKK
jgi:hypothetical protein